MKFLSPCAAALAALLLLAGCGKNKDEAQASTDGDATEQTSAQASDDNRDNRDNGDNGSARSAEPETPTWTCTWCHESVTAASRPSLAGCPRNSAGQHAWHK